MQEWLLYCVCINEKCLNPVLQTSIKTGNFVTFYKFLIHLGMHHTLLDEDEEICPNYQDRLGREFELGE